MARHSTFAFEFSSADRIAGAAAMRRAIYPANIRAISAAVVYGPGVLLIGAAVAGLYFHWWPQYEAMRVLIAIILAILWARFARPFTAVWSRSISNAPSEGVRSVTYAFDDDGFNFHSQFFDGVQRWPGVDRIIETEGFVLLVTGGNAHVLPSRAFPSPEHRNAFAAWAVSRLRPEAQARSRIAS